MSDDTLRMVFESETGLIDQALAEGQTSAAIASLLGVTEEDVDWDRPGKPYWACQECGHRDDSKAMPSDRAKFYARVEKNGSPKCPDCKSIGFMPVGF